MLAHLVSLEDFTRVASVALPVPVIYNAPFFQWTRDSVIVLNRGTRLFRYPVGDFVERVAPDHRLKLKVIQAITTAMKTANLSVTRGKSALKREDLRTARKEFEKAYKLHPRGGSAVPLARLATQKMEYDVAIRILLGATNGGLDEEGDEIDAWLALAQVHQRQGQGGRSDDVLRRLVRSFPKSERAHAASHAVRREPQVQ